MDLSNVISIFKEGIEETSLFHRSLSVGFTGPMHIQDIDMLLKGQFASGKSESSTLILGYDLLAPILDHFMPAGEFPEYSLYVTTDEDSKFSLMRLMANENNMVKDYYDSVSLFLISNIEGSFFVEVKTDALSAQVALNELAQLQGALVKEVPYYINKHYAHWPLPLVYDEDISSHIYTNAY